MTMRNAIAAGLALATLAAAAAGGPGALAAEAEKPKSEKWSFSGIFGTFDRAQLQRGLKVYMTVCANCHSLRQVHYRNLTDIGLTPSEARSVAQTKEVEEIGDDGQPKKRKADLKDRFVSPFANVQAAASANNNKAPPDLSLIVKGREGNEDYLYSVLTGYVDPPPPDWKDKDGKPKKLDSGQHYNKYFPGNIIAMAPPLNEGVAESVGYPKDGPKPTVEQMAKDVTAFLAWASEPTMEERKRTGIKVMLFLLVLTGVFFVIYRRLWRNLH